MRVIVIGAGLLGLSTAYYLKRHGHSVTVLDRRAGPGLETSFANGGMITPSQADPWNAPGIISKLFRFGGMDSSPLRVKFTSLLFSIAWGMLFFRNSSRDSFRKNLEKNFILTNYNLDVIRKLRNEAGINYDESKLGTMKIYSDSNAYEQAILVSEDMKKLGIEFEFLNPAMVLKKEPALEGAISQIKGGIFYPDDEAGDAYKFCKAIAEEAAQQGVEFQYNVEIETFEISPGRSIEAVCSRNGRYHGDAFVLAAGSYSPSLAGLLGLSLPIRPVKGYSLTLMHDGWKSAPRIPVIDDTRHIALTPLGKRLRVAGMAELYGYDRKIYPDRVEKLLNLVQMIYPGITGYLDKASIHEWTGLRPYSGDGVPVMGRTVIDNLFLNTGHGHLGWSMAVGSGKLVAEYISGKKTEIDIHPYFVERFG